MLDYFPQRNSKSHKSIYFLHSHHHWIPPLLLVLANLFIYDHYFSSLSLILSIFSHVYCSLNLSFLHLILFPQPIFYFAMFSFYSFGEVFCFRNVNPLLYVYKYIFIILVSVYDVFCQMKIVYYYLIKYILFFLYCFLVICFAQADVVHLKVIQIFS